jgi:hypothetical protein
LEKKIFKGDTEQVKDGWEKATSWVRTFNEVQQMIFYLNSFAKLNRMACEQSLRRMAKTFLKDPDNVIEKKLMLKTKSCSFFDATELLVLEQELVSFYAKNFTKGDEKRARKIIKFNTQPEARKIDIQLIAGSIGALSVLIPLILFVNFSATSK